MAIDTTEKKLSLINMRSSRLTLPVGDGSFDQGDLQHFLGLYSGILAAASGHYYIYVGSTPTSIDYDSAPEAIVPAGTTSTALTLPDGTYSIAIKSLSLAGVLGDAGVPITVEIFEGAILEPRPSAIPASSVITAPSAAGKIHMEFDYNATDSPSVATEIEIAARAPGGGYDFASPIQTIPITGSHRFDGDLDPTYSNGELVDLGLRSVTELGRPSIVTPANLVIADTIPPAPASSLTATQEIQP